MRADLVRVTPRTLPMKLRFTEDASLRAWCREVERVLSEKLAQLRYDMDIYGTGYIELP